MSPFPMSNELAMAISVCGKADMFCRVCGDSREDRKWKRCWGERVCAMCHLWWRLIHLSDARKKMEAT